MSLHGNSRRSAATTGALRSIMKMSRARMKRRTLLSWRNAAQPSSSCLEMWMTNVRPAGLRRCERFGHERWIVGIDRFVVGGGDKLAVVGTGARCEHERCEYEELHGRCVLQLAIRDDIGAELRRGACASWRLEASTAHDARRRN